METINMVSNTNFTEWGQIIQPEEVMIGSCYNKKDKSAEVTLLDTKYLTKSQSLYKKSVDELTYYRVAQHLSLIYIVDWRDNQLIVCNLIDNETQKLPVRGMKFPLPVCALPDSTLLIGNWVEDGEVNRYKVESSSLTLLWKFSHIPHPSGISFDSTSELIYICTWQGPLFIISLEGR